MTPDRIGTAVGVVCLGIGAVGAGFIHSIPAQRRFFWGFTIAGSLIAGISAAYPHWATAVLASLGTCLAMSLYAYAWTPYLKIGGRIYASLTRNVNAEGPPTPVLRPSEPASAPVSVSDDPYAVLTTAAKAWWGWVALATLCSGGAWAHFAKGVGGWGTTAFIALCLLILGFVGYVEASVRSPVAARQRLQFVLFTLVSAGVGTVLYLLGYAAGRLRPSPGARRRLEGMPDAGGRHYRD